ncbi:MAG: Type fimbrial biosis protein PilY1, partial [Labilithrix sp.]|nr:Type fimbrial biosis protein PilY1 [Labilithrix sp.]
MSRLFLTSSIALGAVVLAFASCANSDEARTEQEDASRPLDAVDSGVDADATSCDAGDPGCRSIVVSCEEAAWCPVPAPVDPLGTLTGVWGSGKDDVFAVGSGGMILRWDGTAWTR